MTLDGAREFFPVQKSAAVHDCRARMGLARHSRHRRDFFAADFFSSAAFSGFQ